MLERFYPSHIFPKLGCTEEQFWDNKALSVGDWAGLAGLIYSEIFSLDILTPLDHTDTSFRLDPHPQADLIRYTEMVQCAQLGAYSFFYLYANYLFCFYKELQHGV